MKCTDHTVLIIDDSKVLRMLVAKMLESEGYVCEGTEDASEALTWLRGTPEKYDCILLDYMMPKMDGLTFLEYVHAEQLFPMANIVMVSASPDTLKPYEEQYGLGDVIAKPFPRGQIISAVRHVCRLAGNAPAKQLDSSAVHQQV